MKIKSFIHIEFAVLMVTLLGGFYMIQSKIDAHGQRINQQGLRTDKLYEMFIDLLKEKR